MTERRPVSSKGAPYEMKKPFPPPQFAGGEKGFQKVAGAAYASVPSSISCRPLPLGTMG